MTAKNRFSRSTTSVAGLPVTNWVEPMMSTKIIATWRSSPPSFGRCFSAAAATSRPTWRPNRSRTRSRSRSPFDHRVEPALQLAEFGAVEHHEVGVEITLFDPVQRGTHHPHGSRREPGQDPHQDEAEYQGEEREDHHRDGELSGGHVLQRKRDDGGQQDAEHRHTRPQRPHGERAAHDARCEPARRRADLECLRGDRTQCELGEQIAARRHDNARKADPEKDFGYVVGVLQAI